MMLPPVLAAAVASVPWGPPPLPPPPPHSTVDASTLEGKLLFGYQGWFDTPLSGAPKEGWVHWSRSGGPNATNSTFDLWPCTDELPPRSCHPTPELTSRAQKGQALQLFSSYPNSTADVHFRWMREYGLDGVFVQRFVNGIGPGPERDKKDGILLHALRAAEANGRVLSVMYDISGAKEATWASDILRDWRHLTQELRVTASPAFLQHGGKHVLSIWGIGFVGHPGTPASSLQLLEDLRAITPITFVGGAPTHWREGKGDSKPGYDHVYAAMDVLSPWLVGRYKDEAGFDRNYQKIFAPDLQRTNALGIGWAPVVFPGFSWSNLMRTTGAGKVVFNAIPRNAGRFWQHQAGAFANMTTGPSTPAPQQGSAGGAGGAGGGRSKTDAPLFIYAAMFDEVDEGTAMLKVVSSIQETPAEGQFLYYSADGLTLPSDFYLSLAGNFTARYQRTRAAAAATAAAAAPQDRMHLGAMSGDEPEAAAVEAGVWREASFRLARELTEQKLMARLIQQQQQQQQQLQQQQQ